MLQDRERKRDLIADESVILLKRPGKPPSAGIKLPRRSVIVGRHSGCDVVIDDPSISRRHAELSIKGQVVSVRDLNSRNGTFVDDERIESGYVLPGQQLRFGGVAWLVEASGDGGEAIPETVSVNDTPLPPQFERLPLSTAEIRVLELLLEGMSEKLVAARLDLSQHTVHNHVREIYQALKVHSRPELLALFLTRDDR